MALRQPLFCGFGYSIAGKALALAAGEAIEMLGTEAAETIVGEKNEEEVR